MPGSPIRRACSASARTGRPVQSDEPRRRMSNRNHAQLLRIDHRRCTIAARHARSRFRRSQARCRLLRTRCEESRALPRRGAWSATYAFGWSRGSHLGACSPPAAPRRPHYAASARAAAGATYSLAQPDDPRERIDDARKPSLVSRANQECGNCWCRDRRRIGLAEQVGPRRTPPPPRLCNLVRFLELVRDADAGRAKSPAPPGARLTESLG